MLLKHLIVIVLVLVAALEACRRLLSTGTLSAPGRSDRAVGRNALKAVIWLFLLLLGAAALMGGGVGYMLPFLAFFPAVIAALALLFERDPRKPDLDRLGNHLRSVEKSHLDRLKNETRR